jgi:hypothetical protein
VKNALWLLWDERGNTLSLIAGIVLGLIVCAVMGGGL